MFKLVSRTPSPVHGRATMRWTPVSRAATLAVMCLSTSWTGMARAENLMDLYVAAKGYDATYLSAKAQAESVQYQVEQAHALFRPALNLQGSVTRSHYDSDVSVPPIYQQFLGVNSYNANVTSKKLALQARQSIYNASDSAKVDQAEQSMVVAQADLKTAEDDLAARLAQAYFDVLAAQDVLTTTQANQKALAEQLASAKRSFEVGNATITDTREAQARYDLAAAQEIAATNDLHIKRITLDQLVGRNDVKPQPLIAPTDLNGLASGEMEDWVTKAQDAPTIRKATAALDVARLEIDKAKAGHLPTVAAVASVQQVDADSASDSARQSAGAGTTSAIGVELNMPLYSGGSVQNRVKEVLKLEEKAERDLDNAKRSVALATRQAYSVLQSGLAQVKALEAAEASAKLALEATQLGYRVGVRINKDVLDAQTALASTQKDLYKARYDVIVASVKLKQVTGVLRPEDLTELNKMIVQP